MMTNDQIRITCKAALIYRPKHEAPDDWVQIVLLHMLKRIHKYDSEIAAYSTWVYHIVRRLKFHHIRRRKLKYIVTVTAMLHENHKIDEDENGINSVVSDVRRAVNKLPKDWRFIVDGILDGYQPKEIGADHGMSRQNVEVKLRRAYQMLREHLFDYSKMMIRG
jgi:RNA polymerase sigma factor (sigma-70 family)